MHRVDHPYFHVIGLVHRHLYLPIVL